MKSPNRILTAVVGFVMMLFIGVFYAWSLFRLQLVETFPDWTSADCSLTFTLFIMFFCTAGFLGGKLSGWLGQRYALWIGAALILTGGMLFSSVGSMSSRGALLVVYLSYGLICGIGAGIGYNVIISGVGALFPKNSGAVSGVLLTGFGFGSLFLGIMIEKATARFGLFPVFRVTTLLIALIVFLGAFRFPVKLRPALPGTSTPSAAGSTPLQMLRTSAFWLYLFWAIFMSSSGLLVINSAAVIAAYFGAMASLGMIVSLFNGFARIGIGVFFDRFGSRASILVNTCCALAAGLLLTAAAATGIVAFMFIGLILAGISYGSTMALNASVIRERFGPAHYSINFSLITLSGIPASFLGPYISGVLQDRAHGTYGTTFLAMIVFALCALVLYLFLHRKISRPHSH
ncbi:MAG: MFS transporter [Oscillospiraceae bacterium]